VGADTDDPKRSSPDEDLTTAHRRFARTALAIYVAAAALSIALLFGAFATDRSHEEAQRKERLLLEAEVRAHYLARHIGLLISELRRLGLRSEVDLLDHNVEPERSLLRLSHDKSTFFDVGVGIVGPDGKVVWAVPQFLTPGASLAREPWFRAVQRSRAVRIVPVAPDRSEDALLYVVSPIIRNQQFAGVLIGAIDLAHSSVSLEASGGASTDTLTVIATTTGVVVYPPKPPPFATEPGWRHLFGRRQPSFLTRARLTGTPRVVAGSQIATATGLMLVRIADEQQLLAPARARMLTRLAIGLSLVLVPLALLILMLVRSLRTFRGAEEDAVRAQRLRLLGEATNLIAHEVKNALNNLRLGVDVVLRASKSPEAKESRAVATLRQELQRLTDFTSELLIFSKGTTPRPAAIDLVELVRRVTDLALDTAAAVGAELEFASDEESLAITADPTLLHVVISNLVGNGLDAAAAAAAPHVWVSVGRSAGAVEVRVADSGAGVPPHVLARLFEPFVTGKPSGVGIGLALSRRIARAHGGDLVHDASAPRTTFRLTLPTEAQR
jgi:signal transduction histidine kinase